MSRDRKASLIWWVTMIALFTVLSTVGMYIERDTFETSAPSIVTGLVIMVLVFGSWIPGAMPDRMRPQQQR